MTRSKKRIISLVLTLCLMFALTISASAYFYMGKTTKSPTNMYSTSTTSAVWGLLYLGDQWHSQDDTSSISPYLLNGGMNRFHVQMHATNARFEWRNTICYINQSDVQITYVG